MSENLYSQHPTLFTGWSGALADPRSPDGGPGPGRAALPGPLGCMTADLLDRSNLVRTAPPDDVRAIAQYAFLPALAPANRVFTFDPPPDMSTDRPRIERPLKSIWKVRHKTLRADQNVFGTDLAQRATHTHYGWDLEAPPGTPVYAIGSGKVIFSQFVTAYGKLVMHSFVFNRKVYYVVYAHLSELKVKQGVRVEVGQEIGLTGTSGNADARDPHLHLEFHDAPTLPRGKNGKVDPAMFFGPPPY